MRNIRSIRTVVLMGVIAATLTTTAPATAVAAITASNVVTPASGTKIVSDNSDGAAANNVTFSGTSTITDAADAIDVLCYRRAPSDSGWSTTVLASGVPTDDVTGTWTISVDVKGVGRSCLVRAVPAGTTPDLLVSPAFTGPTVYFAFTELRRVAAGPNAGTLYGWYAQAGQSGAYNDFGSPQGLSIYNSRLYSGANLRESEYLWYYNAALYGLGGFPFDGTSGLMVDGNYGWLPEAARGATFNGVNGGEMPGFVGIDVTFTHAPATGAVNVVESHPILRCNDGATILVPPASCTSLISTGVRFLRTTTFNADGREIRLVDTFRSLDGVAHAVKAQYYEAHSSVLEPSFGFPWISGGSYALVTDGQSVALPPAAPWSYFAREASTAPDGDLASPQGVRVTSSRPNSFVVRPFNNNDLIQLHEFSIPAGGDFVIQHGFAMSAIRSELDAASTRFQDLFAKPAVAITAPATGSEVTTTPTSVTGTATDNVAVTSLTVNGTAVTPAADGSFSTSVVLTASPSTITVVAKDAAGNETTSTSTVTFRALTFTGTTGNDTLTGNSLANTLNGLEGDDVIDCGAGGMDTALGNSGNDTINCVEPFATAKANADTVNCGSGSKDVAMVDPFDKVVGCEQVTRVWKGSGRRDVFRQTKLANDRFDTLGGNDRVVCGGGIDTVLAGAGNDSVNCADTGTAAARRRSKDVVNCGAGRQDVAIVDASDRTIGCERVVRR